MSCPPRFGACSAPEVDADGAADLLFSPELWRALL